MKVNSCCLLWQSDINIFFATNFKYQIKNVNNVSLHCLEKNTKCTKNSVMQMAVIDHAKAYKIGSRIYSLCLNKK